MEWLDWMFWHYYCFYERHKKMYFGDNCFQAVVIICMNTYIMLGLLAAFIENFICELTFIPQYGTIHSKLFALIYGVPIFLFLDYRYSRKKDIIKNNYQAFRERWGTPADVNKKNLKILVVSTIIYVVGSIIIAVIMGELNKRGLLEGYRLFP